MSKCKGSISIFSLLSLLLVIATLFALLEGTRYQEIKRYTNLQTDVALESAFSNYHQELWKQYRLLGMKSSEADDILMQVADAKATEKGVSLLRFAVETGGISKKTLLTDGKGSVFVKSVATYMRDNVLYELAKGIYNQYESIQQLLKTSGIDLGKIDEALMELDKLKSMDENAKNRSKNGSYIEILECVQLWKDDLTLGLFVEDISTISSEKVNLKTDMFHRTLATGNIRDEVELSWLDRILLQQYILTYLSNYESCIKGHALVYEAEYLIGKSSRDKENLISVISRILAIREAANFVSLLSDSVKVQEAHLLALAIGGISLNPLVLEVIEIAILTGWALAESIVDVRALLKGKRIPLMKSSDAWRLKLEDITLVNETFITAKESKYGLSYKDYLGLLLLFEDELSLAMRTMNAEELTIRKTSGDPFFEMDSLVVQAEAEINYVYSPIFPFLSVISAEERWNYKVRTNGKYGYY